MYVSVFLVVHAFLKDCNGLKSKNVWGWIRVKLRVCIAMLMEAPGSKKYEQHQL